MEPKFRVWHKESKKMFEVTRINWASESQQQIMYVRLWPMSADINDCKLEEIELMQWTGLQGTTGKDIYEGDIVNKPIDTISGTKNQYGIIRFGEHETSDDYYASTAYGFYIEYVNNPFGSTANALDSNTHKDIILIGNVFENPELLKEEQ